MKGKKRVSKVARGRLAKVLVFRGTKERTSGGIKQDGLMKNKRGKVVSKRQSALGKQRYKYVEAWIDSVTAARKALHISGFVALNGQTLTGKALYVKTKALYASKSSAPASSGQ